MVGYPADSLANIQLFISFRFDFVQVQSFEGGTPFFKDHVISNHGFLIGLQLASQKVVCACHVMFLNLWGNSRFCFNFCQSCRASEFFVVFL